MNANQLSNLAAKLGFPPVATVSGLVTEPFASGTWNNAIDSNVLIDLTDPTVFAGDKIASNSVKVSGSEVEFGIYATGVCVEFLNETAINAAPSQLVQARESMYIEISQGGTTRRIRVGVSVAGKPVAGSLATAADDVWYDWSERDFPTDPFAVIPRDLTGCKLVSELDTASTLTAGAIRLHFDGFLFASSSTATASCVDNAGKQATLIGARRMMLRK